MSQIQKEKSNVSKEIFKELIRILLSFLNKINNSKVFKFDIKEINPFELTRKFSNLKLFLEKKVSFETEKLYIYLLRKTYDFLRSYNSIIFNSSYSILYFWRIISYLSVLIQSKKLNTNIEEDDLIKIFFYLLFLFFEKKIDENKKRENSIKYNINLDETFFKGTFIEITEKYSAIESYEDSKGIIDFINHYKEIMKIEIINNLESDLDYIKRILEHHRNKKDDFMNDMHNNLCNILSEIQKFINEDNYDLPNVLIKKINEFYSNEKYLIIIKYISENDKKDLKENIEHEFLKNIEKDYLPFQLDYQFSNNSITNELLKEKLDEYLKNRIKYYKRLKYSWFPEVIKYDWDKEFSIFAFSEYYLNDYFHLIHKFKNKIENLQQNNIAKIIKEILNTNDFYEKYFSILQSNIIKEFFTNNLLKKENSKNINEVYSDFMNKYNKKDENYKKFKNLIIYKILSFGERAYASKGLQIILINPVQFFIGKDLKNDSDIRIILRGYMTIILLNETIKFLGLIEEDGLFINYLFNVYSINHINLEHANKILNINNWKELTELKKIFIGQLEDSEKEKEENVDDFIHQYFRNSISFFSNKDMKGNNREKFNIDQYIKICKF